MKQKRNVRVRGNVRVKPEKKKWHVMLVYLSESKDPIDAVYDALRAAKKPMELTSISYSKQFNIHQRILIRPEKLAICDDCCKVFEVLDENDFVTIPHLNERVEPGGMVPVCVCPVCGALAYPLIEWMEEGC